MALKSDRVSWPCSTLAAHWNQRRTEQSWLSIPEHLTQNLWTLQGLLRFRTTFASNQERLKGLWA